MEIIKATSLNIAQPEPKLFGVIENESTKSWTEENWWTTRNHFSFLEYKDESRKGLATMVVFNDDVMQPKRGFGTHSHSNLEILTYIVEGLYTHKLSTAEAETLGRGSMHYLSAGKGLSHSEKNEESGEHLRYIQMGFVPKEQDGKTRYGSYNGITGGSAGMRLNQWFHMVSDLNGEVDTPTKISQDVNVFVAEIDGGKQLEFEVKEDRCLYALVVESIGGKTIIGEQAVDQHGAVSINRADIVSFVAPTEGKCHILLVEQGKV